MTHMGLPLLEPTQATLFSKVLPMHWRLHGLLILLDELGRLDDEVTFIMRADNPEDLHFEMYLENASVEFAIFAIAVDSVVGLAPPLVRQGFMRHALGNLNPFGM
jgi:hypothetical protein